MNHLYLPATVPLPAGRAMTVGLAETLWDDPRWLGERVAVPVRPFTGTITGARAWAVLHAAAEPRAGHYLGRYPGHEDLELPIGYVADYSGPHRAVVPMGQAPVMDRVQVALGRDALDALLVWARLDVPETDRTVIWQPFLGLLIPLPLVLRARGGWARVACNRPQAAYCRVFCVHHRGPGAGDPWLPLAECVPERKEALPWVWAALREAGADAAELGRRIIAARVGA